MQNFFNHEDLASPCDQIGQPQETKHGNKFSLGGFENGPEPKSALPHNFEKFEPFGDITQ